VWEAGLSKGALYWYFKSQDAVITALLERVFARSRDALRALQEAEGPVYERLLRLTQHVAAELRRMAHLQPITFEFYAAAARQHVVRQFLKQYFKGYCEALAALIRQGIDGANFATWTPERQPSRSLRSTRGWRSYGRWTRKRCIGTGRVRPRSGCSWKGCGGRTSPRRRAYHRICHPFAPLGAWSLGATSAIGAVCKKKGTQRELRPDVPGVNSLFLRQAGAKSVVHGTKCGCMTAKLTQSRPSGALCLLLRLPIWLYRARMGWLLGERFLMLTHIGRKSRRPHQTVLEVVRHDRATGAYVIPSGWGEQADWLRNIQQTPNVLVEAGSRRFEATATRLSVDEVEQELRDYARQHPLAFRGLVALLMGRRSIGTDEAFRLLEK
jgi:deazaflavin-dependent oxidoreductase (nitroreductase family)